jgi:preprotein translocase subunit SecG
MAFIAYLLMVLLAVTAVFLIVLVLVQRGKGGGLAGAFGGMGGQSAFGTKAGDLFTKITIGVAAFWIILCMVTVKVLGVGSEGPLSQSIGGGVGTKPGAQAPLSPGKQPAGGQSSAPAAPAKTPAKSEGKPCATGITS